MTGHNSRHVLLSFIERTERLMEERKALNEDIGEVMAEAKANGFNTKIIRKLISLRAMDQTERKEMEQLLSTYEAAVDGAELSEKGESEEEGS